MRDAAKRNRDDLCTAIGTIIADIPPTECKNYFANSGYGEPNFIPL
ncbi:transposase [Aurantimonas sp. 22II-16-19i]|nr:transposase [Aurantimonas sp. 22II-16-19i]